MKRKNLILALAALAGLFALAWVFFEGKKQCIESNKERFIKIVRYSDRPDPKGCREIGPEDSPALPILIKALTDENRDVRAWSAEAIGQIGVKAKKAKPHLLHAMEDRETSVRMAALKALLRIEKDPGKRISYLSDALEDDDYKVRLLAAWEIKRYGPDAKDAIDDLIGLLDGKDYASEEAISALGAIGPIAIPELVKQLDSSNETTLQNTLFALDRIDGDMSPALPYLKKLITNENSEIRNLSGMVMTKIQSKRKEAVSFLKDMIHDEDEIYKANPAFALAEMGENPDDIVPLLIDSHSNIITNEDYAFTRDCKDESEPVRGKRKSDTSTPEYKLYGGRRKFYGRMWTFGGNCSPHPLSQLGPEAVPYFMNLLKDEHGNPFSRSIAAKVVGKLGKNTCEAVPVLIGLLDDEFSAHAAAVALSKMECNKVDALPKLMENIQNKMPWQAASISALGSMGRDAAPAIPLLIDRLYDANDYIVETATAMALGKIGIGSDEVVDALLGALNDEKSYTRYMAARSILELAPEQEYVLPLVAEHLNDESSYVRLEVVKIVGSYGGRAKYLLPQLKKAFDNETDPEAWSAFKDAIQKIEGH